MILLILLLALYAVVVCAPSVGTRDVPPTNAELDAWDEADQRFDEYRSRILKGFQARP